MKLGAIEWIVFVLVIVGGINLGILGVFDYNLIESLFGLDSTLSRVVYDFVGLSAVWLVFLVAKMSNK